MKIFRNLYIKANASEMESLIARLQANPAQLWQRAMEREKPLSLIGEKAYCFEHQESEGLAAAGLGIFQKDTNTWHVPNVIPLDKNQLSIDEYNALLLDFKNFIEPTLTICSISYELTPDEKSIESIVGRDAALLLQQFSILANKSTGSSHPLDQKRWFDFLLAVNDRHHELNTGLLVRTLMEQGWSREMAEHLAEEYELAEELLDYQKDGANVPAYG